MAGIGFELRRLGREDNLLAPLAAFGHASVVAAGPWMFTILAVALIGSLAELGISRMEIATFRVIIIYAFSISLVVTSPIVIVATRLLADHLYLREVEHIRPLIWSTIVLSMAPTALAAALLYAVAASPIAIGIAGVLSCTLVAGIWATLLFCGAVRDYAGITKGFIAGLVVAILGSVATAWMSGSAAQMTWGFCAGLAVIFFWLLSRLLVTFTEPTRQPLHAIGRHLRAFSGYRVLAIGAFASATAIWIDKWIIWFSPFSETVDGNLLHAPLYDSPMFIAYLVIVPSLAIFVSTLETTFFERITSFYQSIERHATLAQIRVGTLKVERETVRALSRILLLQATLCLLAVLLAPAIVSAAAMQYGQIAILRFGVIGSLFQLLFLVCSSLLLFFGRHTSFALLQIVFLVLQASLTVVTLQYGEDYLGINYVVATVVSATLAVVVLERTIKDLGYLTFSASAAAG